MTDKYILDADGNPQPCEDLDVWAAWYERARRTREHVVASSKDEGPTASGVWVSTVFLALDHQFGSGPPVLWETLVFGGPLDGEMQRYTSRADALRGHQEMCARVAAADSTNQT